MPGKVFETVFQTPLHCQACVDSVGESLAKLEGIESYDIDLNSQVVTIKGNIPPSTVVKSLQAIGKDPVIRGSGKPESAAVCILESFDTSEASRLVKGLARIVEVGEKEIVVDLTLSNLPIGTYYPLIRRSGNLSRGALSTEALFHEFPPIFVAGSSADGPNRLNALKESTSETGTGQLFVSANLGIKDLIGRSIVVSKSKKEVDIDSLCGVIARSAGAWENDKFVCSCSGKNLWQERKDAVIKGISS